MNTNPQKQKIRILVIGPGQTDVGGVTTFIRFLICSTYLNQKFTLIHLDTSRGSKNQATAGRLSFLNLTYLVRQFFTLCKILLSKRPHIVHLNMTAGLSFWKTLVFMLISQAFNAKAVAHIHGGAFEHFFESSGSFTRRLIVWTLSHADIVVVLSCWWQAYIRMMVEKNARILVIPNAPEESYFYRSKADQILEGRDGNTVLFVGSIGRRKGVFDILNAIPLVVRDWTSARFIFLGDEEIAGERELVLKICRESNLNDYVHFAGWVTGDKKQYYYQHADIFILPSHAENLPFSLLEAMSMGLPVVTTPVGGIPEVVEDGKSGYLIQPGNEQELADRILRLLKSSRLRQEQGRNAQLKIQQNYSPETIAQQWEILYLGLYNQYNKSQRFMETAS